MIYRLFHLKKHSKLNMAIPSNLTKEFIEFVKAIGDSKTKQEEDAIVVKEMTFLKKKIMDTKLNIIQLQTQMKLLLLHRQPVKTVM